MELLHQAFIFLAAGVIAVPIAARLGLGSVLGYLIAGALIGPHVFGLVAHPEHIMHFAEFGVVMMLFLIGLELQPSLLWRMRNPIVGLGGLQVLLTAMAIAGITYLADQTWQHAVAIGLILALSSTAIALQILGEKKLLKTGGGQASFAVLLFQDIAVIPIIALLPFLAASHIKPDQTGHHGGEAIANLPPWEQALITVAAVASIIVIGRYLMRHVFRFIAESRLREIFTATALLLVIGIALLMDFVGLSPALGAFIAGVVLANSEYRHELEAEIDPFKALLLGLFFISVGAGIDFDLLAQEPLVIGGVVLSLVALKFAILWGLAKGFGVSGGDRYWFTFGLAQGGEFGFVLLSFSLQNNVLPQATVDLLTVAIALSMVMTPILILANEKWVQPKFQRGHEPDIDKSMMHQDNPVIVAGFGRFGQIVSRLLLASEIPVTILDNNAAHIERVRQAGFTIYYGDANRADLMHTAGADDAKLLVIAVDEREKTREIIETAKRHFPHLMIYCRAYDVVHYEELKAMGVDHIERELFLGSLKVGEKALTALGMRAYQARRKARQFEKHDHETIDRLSQHRGDRKRYISEAKKARAEVLKILQADRQYQQEPKNKAWDTSNRDE